LAANYSTVEPQAVITVPAAIMIVSAVGMAITIYDYYQNPGEFPVQVPGLIEGSTRVKSTCVAIDGNDLVAFGGALTSGLAFFKGVQVLKGAAPAAVGLNKLDLGTTTAYTLGGQFAGLFDIMDEDIYNNCHYVYETDGEEILMPYTTFTYVSGPEEIGCIDGTVMGRGKPGMLEDYPLKEATVTAFCQNCSSSGEAHTHSDGSYLIDDLEHGKKYIVQAHAPDYTLEQKTVYKLSLGQCKTVNFTLEWVGEVTPAPVACFNATPTSGEAPLTVDFDSGCSSGEIDTYSWEFGDGNTSSKENPTHTYHQATTYAARLTVSGPGGEDSTSETITVQEEDHPPTLSNGQVWPETGYANDTEFTFSVVYRDEDGDEPEYHELRISACQPYVDLYLTIPKESGSIESGATYSLTTTLPAAKDYVYYFWFESKGNLVEEPPYDEEPFYNLVVLGNQMIVTSTCPVDLAVTDPDGLVINKEECQIPSATYEEKDIDGDGELDDQIYIPTRKVGDYRILVIPELRARPSDKYTLEVSAGAQTAILADGVQIMDTPDEAYEFESTSMVHTVSLLPGQNLISLGLLPEVSSPEGIFSAISGSLDLRHWNSTTGTWETVVNGRLTDLNPLAGYYIWVPEDVIVAVEGMPLIGDQALTLEKAGWQQIGAPYKTAWGATAGGSMSIEHRGLVKSLVEAVAAGWISGTISQWDSGDKRWIKSTIADGLTLECTPQAGHVGAKIDTCHWADLISCSNSTGLT